MRSECSGERPMLTPNEIDLPRRDSWIALLAAGLAFLSLTGCGKDKVQVYEVSKESDQPAATPMASPPVATAASPHGTASAHLKWKTPSGWEEQPASGVRVATFLVHGDGDQVAEVAVVPLPGATGITLLTVNMWRQELGLPDLQSGDLGGVIEDVPIGGGQGQLVDLTASDQVSEGKKGFRTTAALLSRAGTTWIFKMTGPEALVAGQNESFKEFLKTLEFEAGPAMAAPMLGMGGPMTAPSGPVTVPPTWKFPEHWKALPASGMRFASFAVQGQNGTADVSVIKLGGMAGGVIDNVNRWRGQMGLPPVGAGDLAGSSTKIDLSGGEATYVNLVGTDVKTGQPARVLGAIVPHGDETWFYKMTGAPDVVAGEEHAFVAFVQSVESHP
jgi:hypothetical protein